MDNLSVEVLIRIFELLEIEDLFRLRRTCVRFNKIITSFMHVLVKNDSLVTNQRFFRFREIFELGLPEKLRISHNWKIGRYKERQYVCTRKKFLPWLVLTKDNVWYSQGRFLKAYSRKDLSKNKLSPVVTLFNRFDTDFCKFVVKQGILFSGTRDGGVWMWSEKKKRVLIDNKICHEAEIAAVDCHWPLYITGSKDTHLKLWSFCGRRCLRRDFVWCHRLHDRIWSVVFDYKGEQAATGTAGITAAPLFIVNTETNCKMSLGVDFPRGAGILDIKWDPDNRGILTCGYDNYLRKWDLRTKQCVQKWEDPHMSTLYCLDYDRFCTILTGSQDYGRVTLWDIRTKKFVQTYFMSSCEGIRNSSPVYSVAFDARFLYAATDRCLTALDFAEHQGIPKNYRDIFIKQITVTE